ncbi:hypothetical protein LWX53_00395 [bacterium]|nr:hypothetical protein [bacterium]
MKKRRLALFAAVLLSMGLLLSGCDLIFGLIFTLPGDWSMDYTWSGHSTGNTVVSFNANGTFNTGEGQYGTWKQTGLDISFTYTGPSGANAQYSGKIDFGGQTMEGTMVDPDVPTYGTWIAVKGSSKSLAKNAAPQAPDAPPAGGK